MARVYEESPAPEPSFTRIRGGDRGRRGSHFPVFTFVVRRQPGETNRSSPTSSVVPQKHATRLCYGMCYSLQSQ